MRLLSVIGFAFLSVCCIRNNGYQQKIAFEPTDKIIRLPLSHSTRNNSPCMQFFNHNDTAFFSVISHDLKSIDIYKLDRPERIMRKSLIPSGLSSGFDPVGYYIINPDSVLVISLEPPVVCLVDRNGVLLKKYDLNKNIENQEVRLHIPWGGQFPILKEGKIFLGLRHPTIHTKGILTKKQLPETNIAVSADLRSGNIVLHPLTYPGSLSGKDISGMQVSWTRGYNNEIVYMFDLQDSIYTTRDMISSYSHILNTNYKFAFPEKNFKFISDIEGSLLYNLQHDEIQNIFFDTYRSLYYICVKERQDSINNLAPDLITRNQYRECFIIILDTDFNYLGEVFFPDNLYYFQKIFVVPEGVYISLDHVYSPLFNEDTLKLRLFRIIRTD